MRSLLLTAVIAIATSAAMAADIKKWIDEDGRVHYGDKPEGLAAEAVETLKIEDSFDQQAYDEALQRQQQREEDLAESDKEYEKQQKEATRQEEERKERLKTRRY